MRTGKDLAKHFLNVVEQKSTGFDEVHVIFDRYDIANSLKERTRQLRYGDQRSISYHISDDAVIEKTTLKQLLSSNTNKEKLCPLSRCTTVDRARKRRSCLCDNH